jgi:hypothetical protein
MKSISLDQDRRTPLLLSILLVLRAFVMVVPAYLFSALKHNTSGFTLIVRMFIQPSFLDISPSIVCSSLGVGSYLLDYRSS